MKYFFLIASALISVSQAAFARPSPALVVEGPRLFIPVQGSNATAAYGVFRNTTPKDFSVSVVGVKEFKAIEMHESYEKDGKMHMRKIESLVVPAQGTVELKPGGHHIMLFDVTRPLKNGEMIELSLKTEDGKSVKIPFKVVPREGTQEHAHSH